MLKGLNIFLFSKLNVFIKSITFFILYILVLIFFHKINENLISMVFMVALTIVIFKTFFINISKLFVISNFFGKYEINMKTMQIICSAFKKKCGPSLLRTIYYDFIVALQKASALNLSKYKKDLRINTWLIKEKHHGDLKALGIEIKQIKSSLGDKLVRWFIISFIINNSFKKTYKSTKNSELKYYEYKFKTIDLNEENINKISKILKVPIDKLNNEYKYKYT